MATNRGLAKVHPSNLALAALVLGLGSIPVSAQQAPPEPPFVPGEVLVQFKETAGNLQKQNALARAGVEVREHLRTEAMERDGAPGLLRAAAARGVRETVEALRRNPDVAFAEPNYIVTHSALANDPMYSDGYCWGNYGDDLPVAIGGSRTTNAWGTGAEDAWNAGHVGSRDVYVGVIDEGVQIAHPDLAANIWTNPFDVADGRDNDGNGYVDDVHGWDFYNRDNSVYDGGTGDRHGTHVSGTVGAVGNNALGLAGMSWRVTIIPVKFLGANGGTTSDAVRALDYLTNLKVRHGLNIVATNNSWGGAGYSQALADACIRAAKQDILTIAAAGNNGTDNDTVPFYPAALDTTRATSTQTAASYDGVISVAAIDKYGALASFSNYGASSVDLGAPGVTIASTLPTDTYGYYSGTSMATPHVTGAVALYGAANPGAPGGQVRDAILRNVKATASLGGKTATGGRLAVGDGLLASSHDVAVDAVGAPASVSKGASATVTVMVTNQGTMSETFSVSVTDVPPSGGTAGSLGAPRSVTLPAGASTSLGFTWSTSNASAGTHQLRATASTLPGETDTADNGRSTSSSVVVAPAPWVSSIMPNTMRAGTPTSVVVRGSRFAAGARLTFVGGSASVPTATNVVVSSDGMTITATVNASRSGASNSSLPWDVRVTNPDGKYGTRLDAFRVRR